MHIRGAMVVALDCHLSRTRPDEPAVSRMPGGCRIYARLSAAADDRNVSNLEAHRPATRRRADQQRGDGGRGHDSQPTFHGTALPLPRPAWAVAICLDGCCRDLECRSYSSPRVTGSAVVNARRLVAAFTGPLPSCDMARSPDNSRSRGRCIPGHCLSWRATRRKRRSTDRPSVTQETWRTRRDSLPV